MLRSEVFRIRWVDEREKKGVEYFVLKDPEDNRIRPIILNSVAKNIVRKASGRYPDYVFPKRDVGKAINKAWIEAGLPNQPLIRKGINILRFTYENRLRLAGANNFERNLLLGRKCAKRDRLYSIVDFKRLAELAEKTTTVRDPDMPVYMQMQ